jgi:hypothetical protein
MHVLLKFVSKYGILFIVVTEGISPTSQARLSTYASFPNMLEHVWAEGSESREVGISHSVHKTTGNVQ